MEPSGCNRWQSVARARESAAAAPNAAAALLDRYLPDVGTGGKRSSRSEPGIFGIWFVRRMK